MEALMAVLIILFMAGVYLLLEMKTSMAEIAKCMREDLDQAKGPQFMMLPRGFMQGGPGREEGSPPPKQGGDGRYL